MELLKVGAPDKGSNPFAPQGKLGVVTLHLFVCHCGGGGDCVHPLLPAFIWIFSHLSDI